MVSFNDPRLHTVQILVSSDDYEGPIYSASSILDTKANDLALMLDSYILLSLS